MPPNAEKVTLRMAVVLRPGAIVQHMDGATRTLDRRKEDGTGWWVVEHGGLGDWVLEGDKWTVIYLPPNTRSEA